jgi:hypothetical protein
MQNDLDLIDPGNPNGASIYSPGWIPTQRDVDDMWDSLNEAIDDVAHRIASGHASGGYYTYEFEALINRTIRHPSESGILKNGRSYYYNREEDFIVIIDPGNQDRGSAFVMKNWNTYKPELEK